MTLARLMHGAYWALVFIWTAVVVWMIASAACAPEPSPEIVPAVTPIPNLNDAPVQLAESSDLTFDVAGNKVTIYLPFRTKRVGTRTLSVYGREYIGRNMSNGKPYRPNALTVASNDWPLGTRLFLVSIDERAKPPALRSEIVTVTDRMAKRFSGVRIDASERVWDALSGGKPPGLVKGVQVFRVEEPS